MRRLSIYPSASKLGLATRCAYPWTSGLAWPQQESGAAARLGTAAHAIAERLVLSDLGATYALEYAEQHGMDSAEARTLQALAQQMDSVIIGWDGDLRAEVAIAYDPSTDAARLLETSGARDYSQATPGELVGTADVVRLAHDGRLIVVDWKTGRGARETRVADTMQMRFLGLAFARLHARDSVTIQLAHVDEHDVWVDSATLDAWELDAIAAEMRQLAATLAAEPKPTPGDHCSSQYCPLLSECPATRSALAEVAGAELAPAYPLSTAITSTEHALYIYQRIGAVEAAVEQIRKALREYAMTHGPLDVGGGKAWGPVQQDGRESIDLSVEGAEALLRERLGEAASKAIEVSTSKDAIKRAAGSAKAQRAILDELRALGAIRQGAPWTKWQEFARVADAE